MQIIYWLRNLILNIYYTVHRLLFLYTIINIKLVKVILIIFFMQFRQAAYCRILRIEPPHLRYLFQVVQTQTSAAYCSTIGRVSQETRNNVVFFAMGTKPKSIVGNKTCKVGEPRPFLDAIIGGVYIHIFVFCPTDFF